MGTVIGVFPLYDEKKESIWMLPGYLGGIQLAGGTPIILPQKATKEEVEQLVDVCDGFLFTGGHDVGPALYHQRKSENCGMINKERDQLEQQFFELAYALDKPMLGICRGIQMINVLLGGTLYQDLATEYESPLDHVMNPPYNREQHQVLIEKNSPLYHVVKKNRLGVNSYHHQAVKDLAPELTVMAKATDGLVEAVYSKTKRFVWAVQWHPEFFYEVDEASQLIFQNFVDACENCACFNKKAL